MNLIDCYVTKVLSEPEYAYQKWWVSVEYDGYGRIGKGCIECDTLEQARQIKPGYKFQR